MKIKNIQFYMTYAFLFACVFFVGFDNISLFQKIFPRNMEIDSLTMLSSIGVSFGGVVIGLLIFRRIIKKQPLDFIMKISLLSSAFFSWLQFYLPYVLDFSSLHIQTITVFITNISMGIFLYCSQTILKEKDKTKRNLTTTLLWVFFIIGMLAISHRLFANGQDGISIICATTYTLGFINAMTLKGNDFMEIKHSNPYSHLGILIGIIYLILCYFLYTSFLMSYLKTGSTYQAVLILFASLFFWLKPSVNKASVVLFLIFSQILG